MMTINEMKQIIETEAPFSNLVCNAGIYEFHEADGVSIGISYETNDHGELVYIYNLFCGPDEYINIYGEGNRKDPIPDEIVKELAEVWNDIFDKKKPGTK